ncbi:hypothetical protein [Shinella sp.]|uniref:hypothetical protein n=1 Tax=Shinella sp. TaxID=1870904 RepID=UPI003F7176CA
MSNIINFPISTREVPSITTTRVNAEIITFPYQHGQNDEYRFYVSALKNALCELERAQVAGNYYEAGEWRDEIDVIRLTPNGVAFTMSPPIARTRWAPAAAQPKRRNPMPFGYISAARPLFRFHKCRFGI